MFVLHFFWITLNIKVTQAWQLTHGIALLWQQRQENTHQFQASCENLSQKSEQELSGERYLTPRLTVCWILVILTAEVEN